MIANDLLNEARQQLTRYSRANPDLETLPEWVSSLRVHQRDACDEILDSYSRCNLVVLDAPTGSGKTLIAEVVRRLIQATSTLYVCHSKSLQTQFIKDYPYARLLQGRSNYPTERFPQRFQHRNLTTRLDCSDCSKPDCNWCSSLAVCPYERAKREGLSSALTVLNTAYFLTECNGPGRFSGRELVVLDECDTVEREIMNYVSVEITERRRKSLGLESLDKRGNITKPEAWLAWIDRSLPTISDTLVRLPSTSDDIKVVRERKILSNLRYSLDRIRTDLRGNEGSWVYTGSDGSVSFKPSKVNTMAGRLLWQHGKKWLLMSGSVISAEELLDSLGWDKPYEVVRVPSTFPAKNRQIKIRPVVNMAKSAGELSDKSRILRDEITAILTQHRAETVLVHTVSYDITRALTSEQWDRPALSYDSPDTRDQVLRRIHTRELCERGVVIFAPSFDRGIDLPDDLCRVQIVAKVPYPYLGDRQISARLHSDGGRLWYAATTARSLIQMTGRAVRHKDDWCVTYVLDQQFVKFFKQNKYLFPEWWQDGLEWRY